MESSVTIQIDKGIPVPETRHGNGGTFNAAVGTALQQMSVGDSFSYSDGSKSQSLSAVVRYVAKKAGIKVVIRKIADDEFRVWRAE